MVRMGSYDWCDCKTDILELEVKFVYGQSNTLKNENETKSF